MILAIMAPIELGQVLGERYRLDLVVGQGSAGTIYQATQVTVHRTVALKVLHPELLGEADLVSRFLREAQVVSQLSHPNIVRLIDFGVDEASSLPFLVLEHVRGANLRERLQLEGPMPEARAVALMAQAARALCAAHEIGLVHRDLKPDNLMLERLPAGDELLRVLDFGVVKIFGEEALTAAGAKVGTPRYMSPEQIRGEVVDGRADLYGLGCVLHEVLTGRSPYEAPSMVELLAAHIRQPIPALPPALVDGRPPSAGLVALHQALLAKKADGRPASAEQVVRLLDQLARAQPVDATPATARDSPAPWAALTPVAAGSVPGAWTPTPVLPSARRAHPSRASRWAAGVIALSLLGLGAWAVATALTAPTAVETRSLSGPRGVTAEPRTAERGAAPAPGSSEPERDLRDHLGATTEGAPAAAAPLAPGGDPAVEAGEPGQDPIRLGEPSERRATRKPVKRKIAIW